MDLGLKERVAVVTGASQGLGKAAALALAQEGCRVAVCSRSATRIKAAADDIRQRTRAEVYGGVADVVEPEAGARFLAQVRRKLGPPDILVLNAGGPPAGSFEAIGDAEWRRGFEQNFLGASRWCRDSLPGMARRGWGRVVFIASTSAKQPIEGLVVSNAIRAGLLGLSKTLSEEYGPFGVTVNVVCPGYTDTERLEELERHVARKKDMTREAVRRSWAQACALRRIAKPKEIASAVAFLCSERAAYITGVALAVDGGRTKSIL